jgi:hypothetical protein
MKVICPYEFEVLNLFSSSNDVAESPSAPSRVFNDILHTASYLSSLHATSQSCSTLSDRRFATPAICTVG